METINTINNEKEFELVSDFYHYILSKMDFEWENLPDGYEADNVKLGDVEYKALIRYTAFEEIVNYMEKRCPGLEE